ncbi:hypothetical protein HY993_01815 [Candidatus Micrarchaeota archaeon]|nr:hypothetical protein [Candidatus Micrarchaeota archaeon]
MFDVLTAKVKMAAGDVVSNAVSGVGDVVILAIILLIGYVVAKILARVVVHILDKYKMEAKLRKKGVENAFAGFTLTEIISSFTKILVVTIFLGIAADVLKLNFIKDLVLWVLGYVPSLVQGAVILIGAFLGGAYVADKIKASRHIPFAKFLGIGFHTFVAYTAVVIALPLILPGADTTVLKLAFGAFVLAFAIAIGLGFGLAIGLGAKDTVASIAKSKKSDLEKIIG